MMRGRLILSLVVLVAACGSTPRQLPSDGMVVPATADQLRSGTDGDGSLEYSTREAYPGSATIEQIRTTLSTRGWHRRQFEFLNGSPFVVTARWRDVDMGDGVTSVWYEQWESATADVVAYQFTYLRPRGVDAPTGPLRVKGIYFRSGTVRSLERESARPAETR
jgi:hypothetical protein